jgi:hypothetical protein
VPKWSGARLCGASARLKPEDRDSSLSLEPNPVSNNQLHASRDGCSEGTLSPYFGRVAVAGGIIQRSCGRPLRMELNGGLARPQLE